MKLFGLIGFPLSHSFSAKWFADKFKAEHIANCEYRNFPLESVDELPDLIRTHPDLRGFNVTIPYKEKVMPLLGYISPTAKEIGAVNCVRIEDDKTLSGFNTDAWGFEQSILPFLENRFERALIIGTGGASKAVDYVLRKRGIETWFVSTSKKGNRFMAYDELDAFALNHFKLIVQCTPRGTFPANDDKPDLPYSGITREHLLYDLVYNPPVTAFLLEGQKRGAQIINGLRMLEGQAQRSWDIWNGSADPEFS